MDKNFIRIDDLVRQRMGGGEEKERSGAWLNMRELLDKEMPQQRRIGILYWHRLFSVVAALSLLGTVCVGGYEFSSLYRSRNTGNNNYTLAEATTANKEANSIYALPASAATTNETETDKNRNTTIRNNKPAENKTDNTGQSNMPDAKTMNTGLVVTNAGGNKPIVDNPITIDNKTKKKTHRSTNNVTNNNKKQSATEAANTVATVKDAEGNSAINVAEQHVAKGDDATAKKQTVQNVNTLAGDDKAPIAKLALNDPTALALPGGNPGTANPVAIDNKQNGSNTSSSVDKGVKAGNSATTGANVTTNNSANTAQVADNKPVSENGVSGAIAKVDDNNSQASKAGVAAGANKGEKMVLNSSANNKNTTTGDAGKVAEVAGNTSKVKNSNTAAKSNTSGSNSSKGISRATTTPPGVLAAKTTKTALTTGGGRVDKTIVKSTKPALTTGGGRVDNGTAKAKDKVASNNTKPAEKAPVNTYSTGGAIANNTDAEAANINKKVMLKLLLHERLVKTGENKDDYTHKLDTISMIWVDMAMGKDKNNDEAAAGIAEDKNASAPVAKNSKPRNSRHGGRAPRKNGGSNNASGNASAADLQEVASASGAGTPNAAKEGSTGSAELTPAASMSNDETPVATKADGTNTTTDKAKTTTTKKGNGISLVKKLSLAFNDVKTNASTAQFVPGVIAGINSNFFGPNSFKGFQFGVTGNLVFNDTWNLMTELKYFQRINNNSAVQDNYYTYTQVGTNEYRKELQLNSYGFSALHSLEIPVSIRYSKGNFNFYTGGNFLYAFSINTGASTMPDPNTPVEIVSQPGTDNTPTFKGEDFRSRFGLGYLFGFSYQVAPNFNIDLRSVQTVWDNAATTGAKSVSAQLYKSPSLQLSIMYRLGGNRHKD